MSDTSNSSARSVFARADALMQLRRHADSPVAAEPPVLTEALPDEDDLPLLTEVVTADHPSPGEPPPATAISIAETLPNNDGPPLLMADIAAQQNELSTRLREHLHAELPAIMATMLQDALPELRQELESRLDAIATELIAELTAEQSRG